MAYHLRVYAPTTGVNSVTITAKNSSYSETVDPMGTGTPCYDEDELTFTVSVSADIETGYAITRWILNVDGNKSYQKDYKCTYTYSGTDSNVYIRLEVEESSSSTFDYQLRVYAPPAQTYYLKLNFNANGGSGAPSSVTGNASTSGTIRIDVEDENDYTVEYGTSGSTSTAWINERHANGARYIYATVSDDAEIYRWKINIDGDISYQYASSQKQYCFISENLARGASNIQVLLELKTNTSDLVVVNIPEQEPTRTNWKFAGWSTNAQGDPPIRYPKGTYTNTGSTDSNNPATYTLYAVWTQNGDPYVWLNIGGGKSSWKKYIMWVNVGGGPSSWYKIRVWVDTNSGNHWEGGVQ